LAISKVIEKSAKYLLGTFFAKLGRSGEENFSSRQRRISREKPV
jgi:hypothetical protein